jgi:hypothetical protein
MTQTMPNVRRSSRAPRNAQAGFVQYLGSAAIGLVIAAGAVVVGVHHHKTWLVLLALLTVAFEGWVIEAARGWYHRWSTSRADDFRLWWRRRGALLMLGAMTPMAITALLIPLALRHHA